MSDNKIWKIAGKNETSAKSRDTTAKYQQDNSDVILTSSQAIYDSVSYKNIVERDRYNRLLLGKASRAEVGQDAVATNLTARPPSWTQHAAGLNHSFVINAVSASQHEVQCLNAYDSGSSALEQSPVPASSSMFYSKQNKLVKMTYKLSASADLATQLGTVFYPNIGMFISRSFTPENPFSIPINVPIFGKIKDVKVWVELIHSSASNEARPLGATGIALRSPNVKFKHAHPILNDKTFNETNMLIGVDIIQPKIKSNEVQDFYSNSYLLWEGPSLFANDYDVINTTFKDTYGNPGWSRDRHIRTIFTDSSRRYNPRHLDKLTANSLTIDNLHDNAPCSGATAAASAFGNDVPWITDQRLSGSGGTTTYTAAGSPPAGWLTHPNGGADLGEFATAGSSWGPNDIRPVYPLLDNLVATKKIVNSDGQPLTNLWLGITELEDYPTGNARYRKWKGERPGLRGTEVHGTWELLVSVSGTGRIDDALHREPPNIYFRQWRLELLLEQDKEIRVPRKYKTSHPAAKPGLQLKHTISGSGMLDLSDDALNFNASSDWYPTEIYAVTPEQPGIFYGITDNTGTLSNFAVFTRITGALADFYTASNRAHARYKFLNNEFGTPYIPLSSGSGLPAESEITSVKTDKTIVPLINGILNPATNFGRGQTMTSIKTLTRPSRTTRDKMLEITSGSAP